MQRFRTNCLCSLNDMVAVLSNISRKIVELLKLQERTWKFFYESIINIFIACYLWGYAILMQITYTANRIFGVCVIVMNASGK